LAYTLRPQPRFTRKFKKLVPPRSALAERFERTLTLLSQNPAAPSLRTHKVNLSGVRVYSSSVTGDLRIIWRYAEGVVDIIDLLDVGGHEGGKSVYR
jgi:mRNA-degrading endonuclease YafQ of YafQ-DinJ toxin-antitoxin module